MLKRVRQQAVDGFEFEIIVVNDGSVDATADLINQHANLHDQFIDIKENRGKGAAVIAGLEAATGSFVLIQDADLEYDPSDYTELLTPVHKHEADIVIGSRMLAPKYTRVHYYWHKVGNRLITFLFNLLYNTTLTDLYSGYVVLRLQLIDTTTLKCHGWGQQAEIMGQSLPRAKTVYEVPISYHGRSYREGKKIKAIHTIGVIWQIFRNRF